ncbi:MAG: hypothetical protein H7Y36_09010 [Armatimonadetes bacterium]|nr:hypothetical protein [Akkermansiaceae bacterium]
MKNEDEKADGWDVEDETWKLLAKAAPNRAGDRFLDETMRAVKLLPDADPWWPRILTFPSWAAVAGCAALAGLFFMNGHNDSDASKASVAVKNSEDLWVEIEEEADAEMLSAAVEHLDEFSDHEIASLIGF